VDLHFLRLLADVVRSAEDDLLDEVGGDGAVCEKGKEAVGANEGVGGPATRDPAIQRDRPPVVRRVEGAEDIFSSGNGFVDDEDGDYATLCRQSAMSTTIDSEEVKSKRTLQITWLHPQHSIVPCRRSIM
jgi:hypothetical protein